jgi:tRNA pseudouridine38-40 synthase
MFNKKCIVQYDGTWFSGWQIQNGLRTVQGEITSALSKIYKHSISIYGAGRTDAKVHAEEQVFNFFSDRYIENKNLMAGMNSLLSQDVVSISVEDVSNVFHARKSAKMKTYTYRIFNSDIRSVFYANRAWWVKRKLNLSLLEMYLNYYVGEKDFKKYCKNSKVYAHTIRTIYSIEVDNEKDFIVIKLTANGFLRRMVRNIVGTAVRCSIKGKALGDLDNNIYTAPPHGLYLTHVFY